MHVSVDICQVNGQFFHQLHAISKMQRVEMYDKSAEVFSTLVIFPNNSQNYPI